MVHVSLWNFGNLPALYESVTQTTSLIPQRKEQPNEGQDEHEGRQRSLGWLNPPALSPPA